VLHTHIEREQAQSYIITGTHSPHRSDIGMYHRERRRGQQLSPHPHYAVTVTLTALRTFTSVLSSPLVLHLTPQTPTLHLTPKTPRLHRLHPSYTQPISALTAHLLYLYLSSTTVLSRHTVSSSSLFPFPFPSDTSPLSAHFPSHPLHAHTLSGSAVHDPCFPHARSTAIT